MRECCDTILYQRVSSLDENIYVILCFLVEQKPRHIDESRTLIKEDVNRS